MDFEEYEKQLLLAERLAAQVFDSEQKKNTNEKMSDDISQLHFGSLPVAASVAAGTTSSFQDAAKSGVDVVDLENQNSPSLDIQRPGTPLTSPAFKLDIVFASGPKKNISCTSFEIETKEQVHQKFPLLQETIVNLVFKLERGAWMETKEIQSLSISVESFPNSSPAPTVSHASSRCFRSLAFLNFSTIKIGVTSLAALGKGCDSIVVNLNATPGFFQIDMKQLSVKNRCVDKFLFVVNKTDFDKLVKVVTDPRRV
jgi:hypothetical protein